MILRQLCFPLLFFTTLSLQAQTQQGYVKTLGRPNQKGVALSGVSIRFRGEHNAVLSDVKVFFSMIMTGKKKGDAYALQQVQKQGYELTVQNLQGGKFKFKCSPTGLLKNFSYFKAAKFDERGNEEAVYIYHNACCNRFCLRSMPCI